MEDLYGWEFHGGTFSVAKLIHCDFPQTIDDV